MNVDIDITNVRLRTERLILRPWEPADVGDLFEYASVDGVGQMAGWAPHESLENSREILDMFINGKHVFALEYRGKAVGSLGIEKYNEKELPEFAGKRGAELGFVLSKDLWGKGLVVEAVREVVRYLFEELKLDFITCGYFEWNRQSGRVKVSEPYILWSFRSCSGAGRPSKRRSFLPGWIDSAGTTPLRYQSLCFVIPTPRRRGKPD